MLLTRTSSGNGTDTAGWMSVMEDIAAAFAMDEAESRKFQAHWAPRLIAALPFLAGAERPDRTAAVHLGTYVLSVRETRHRFFAACDDDGDVFARLAPIARFQGGDQRIIDRGMAILALNMVIDYKRDRDVDRVLGKYNPVAAGVWDADAIINDLRTTIDSIECPEMDATVYGDGGDGPEGYWLYG